MREPTRRDRPWRRAARASLIYNRETLIVADRPDHAAPALGRGGRVRGRRRSDRPGGFPPPGRRSATPARARPRRRASPKARCDTPSSNPNRSARPPSLWFRNAGHRDRDQARVSMTEWPGIASSSRAKAAPRNPASTGAEWASKVVPAGSPRKATKPDKTDPGLGGGCQFLVVDLVQSLRGRSRATVGIDQRFEDGTFGSVRRKPDRANLDDPVVPGGQAGRLQVERHELAVASLPHRGPRPIARVGGSPAVSTSLLDRGTAPGKSKRVAGRPDLGRFSPHGECLKTIRLCSRRFGGNRGRVLFVAPAHADPARPGFDPRSHHCR